MINYLIREICEHERKDKKSKLWFQLRGEEGVGLGDSPNYWDSLASTRSLVLSFLTILDVS